MDNEHLSGKFKFSSLVGTIAVALHKSFLRAETPREMAIVCSDWTYFAYIDDSTYIIELIHFRQPGLITHRQIFLLHRLSLMHLGCPTLTISPGAVNVLLSGPCWVGGGTTRAALGSLSQATTVHQLCCSCPVAPLSSSTAFHSLFSSCLFFTETLAF